MNFNFIISILILSEEYKEIFTSGEGQVESRFKDKTRSKFLEG